MTRSQSYNERQIIMVDLSTYFHDKQYEGKKISVDQMPLFDFHGFSMLSWLVSNKGLSESDRKYIMEVVMAYGDFPVRIKCSGRGEKCDNTSTRLVLPYEYVYKHEMQSGPKLRKQYDVPARLFYCPGCSDDFSYSYSAGSTQKGTTRLPINFKIFKTRDEHGAWNFTFCNLDRSALHGRLKRIAKEILFQGLDIDTGRIDPNARTSVGKKEAREIVKRLLEVADEQLTLSGEAKSVLSREVYQIKRKPQKNADQMKLPFDKPEASNF